MLRRPNLNILERSEIAPQLKLFELLFVCLRFGGDTGNCQLRSRLASPSKQLMSIRLFSLFLTLLQDSGDFTRVSVSQSRSQLSSYMKYEHVLTV